MGGRAQALGVMALPQKALHVAHGGQLGMGSLEQRPDDLRWPLSLGMLTIEPTFPEAMLCGAVG